MGLAEIAFPYRANRQFGASSFALIFIVLLLEIEALIAVGFALLGRLDELVRFQTLLLPAVVLVSLSAAAIFTFRARSWTRKRLALVREYGAGAGAFGERLAQRSRGQ